MTGDRRICVIGAGPCGLTALKNLLQAGCRDVICYEESAGVGGNWAFTEDPDRASVYECAHTISSRRLSSFHDFPMPADYPDFPSHRQMLAYFTDYARAFHLSPYLRLGSRVERCDLDADGRWTVWVSADDRITAEVFDAVLVCTGHHREPVMPDLPGTFAGTLVHSSRYKRPDPFRGQRVLVVGAGNSAADIAVDVARVAAYTAISLRRGTYIVPKLILGWPIDVVYGYWQPKLPRPLLRSALKLWLRLAVGAWQDYGLPAPTDPPLARPPTVSSNVLDALRDGRLTARRDVERLAGRQVQFTDGTSESFDAVVLATGFRVAFPFLPEQVAHPDMPLYLRMMHPTIPSLLFIGLFQPVGCIWRLADTQARIAALQLSGQLRRPPDIAARIRRETAGAQGIEVDYHRLRRALARELSRPALRRG